jgi:hypothetical protein
VVKEPYLPNMPSRTGWEEEDVAIALVVAVAAVVYVFRRNLSRTDFTGRGSIRAVMRALKF